MVCLSLLRISKGPLPAPERLQRTLSMRIRLSWSFSKHHWSSSSSQVSAIRRLSSGAAQSTTAFYTPEEILDECSGLYDSLTSINERLGGVAIPKSSHIHTSMPFCLLVGNHSSGKSSFINYVLQRNIQKAGVAPTDDTFTVIAPGPEDADADGPTLIGDPDLGFASLRQFGPTLIHHTQLKYRTSRLNFMLVDSPGMIDSPGGNKDFLDRGYDFQGVIRWFAQRADIVCIFFDPDKPGTTGETMSVLLNSLSGMDHKLLIVLNKADQFEKIHDFARAYGSLCWNLSKVIPRKDLPPIFTMSLPDAGSKTSSLSPSLSDLEHTRDDVVNQVLQAPKRRIDNVITNLYDSTSTLILYSKIWNDIVARYNKEWRRCVFQEGGLVAGAGLTLAAANHLGLDATIQGAILGTSVLGIGGLVWYHRTYLQRIQEDLTTLGSLSTSFQRTHALQVQDADEYIASLWQRVRDALQSSLTSSFEVGGSLPTVSAAELRSLEDILDKEIPRLRRMANATKVGIAKPPSES
ncbi:dynamin family protein [Nitzschia inconspicua]|uniref:Dynamin family protein n=1 Tax=Nitzschia inconspicua TaxID=303405 RepID=A0A9K3LQG7_9STRA|nr:dynamin family protein [Nitzschia inconspicua]